MTISASDLETTMKTKVENAQADNNGHIAIPAKPHRHSQDFFRSATNLDRRVYLRIEISSENGKFKLSGQNGRVPTLPTMESSSETSMPHLYFYRLLTKLLCHRQR